ncbi:MAG TPA: hydroxyisourate hydrolase [Polyangiaceae bacterium]|jgi:5-hydroxyisourate hydrolase|nr:hydroxyisourate hydrolase [Polyangiaceae bacterium]
MISSHVLDTSLGRPASALAVHLDVLEPDGQWRRIASAHTNPDGRASDLAGASSLTERTCRLTFETGPYFALTSRATCFPRVEVIFVPAAGAERYHIPLLLSPFGFTAYRGS